MLIFLFEGATTVTAVDCTNERTSERSACRQEVPLSHSSWDVVNVPRSRLPPGASAERLFRVALSCFWLAVAARTYSINRLGLDLMRESSLETAIRAHLETP